MYRRLVVTPDFEAQVRAAGFPGSRFPRPHQGLGDAAPTAARVDTDGIKPREARATAHQQQDVTDGDAVDFRDQQPVLVALQEAAETPTAQPVRLERRVLQAHEGFQVLDIGSAQRGLLRVGCARPFLALG